MKKTLILCLAFFICAVATHLYFKTESNPDAGEILKRYKTEDVKLLDRTFRFFLLENMAHILLNEHEKEQFTKEDSPKLEKMGLTLFNTESGFWCVGPKKTHLNLKDVKFTVKPTGIEACFMSWGIGSRSDYFFASLSNQMYLEPLRGPVDSAFLFLHANTCVHKARTSKKVWNEVMMHGEQPNIYLITLAHETIQTIPPHDLALDTLRVEKSFMAENIMKPKLILKAPEFSKEDLVILVKAAQKL